jgi:hypothetical protein
MLGAGIGTNVLLEVLHVGTENELTLFANSGERLLNGGQQRLVSPTHVQQWNLHGFLAL